MSGKLPALTGEQVVEVLQKAGFVVLRTRSSHNFMRHPDGRTTVVPVHAGETFGPGLMSKILRDCDISRKDFAKLVRKM